MLAATLCALRLRFATIQIVTGVEVLIENFIPEVREMLPEIEDNIL